MAQNKPNPKETNVKRHVCGSREEHHHSLLGEHAAILWKHNKITDVVIKLQNRFYRAHKAVLSCYSEYFRDRLLKHFPADGIIELNEPSVTSEAFEVVLMYMYTGELKLTCQNIGDVYTAARKFVMKDVVIQCANILAGKSKKLVHYVYLYVTARKLGMWEACKKAMRNMQRHFEQIAGTKEFLDLDNDQLCELLSADELAVRSEVVVYLSGLKWISEKFLEREKYAVAVIGCVRFPLMTLNEVLACYTPPLLPAVVELPEVRNMLLEATCYVAAKTVNDEKRFLKFSCKPRVYLVEREAIVLWDPNIFDSDRYRQYKEDVAATKIQAMYRGYSTRKKLQKQQELENIAATKIQAQFRGFAARKRVDSLRLSIASQRASVPLRSLDLTSPPSSPTATVRLNISDAAVAPPKEDQQKQEKDTSSVERTAHPAERATDYDSRLPQTAKNVDQPKPTTYFRDTVESSSTITADDPCIRAFMQNRKDSLESLSSSIRSNARNSKLLQQPHSYKAKKFDVVGDPKGVRKEGAPDSRLDSLGFKQGYSSAKSYEMPPKPVLHKIFTEPASNVSQLSSGQSSSSANSGMKAYDDRDEDIVEKNVRATTIITMGGFNPGDQEKDQIGKAIHRYVPITNEWSKIGDMRQCYHHHCTVYYNDCIYCIGGCDPLVSKRGVMIPVSSCSKYNLETNLWYNVCSMSDSRMYHGVVVLNDRIYAIGGKDENDSMLDSLECYDPSVDRWELLETPLSCKKMGFGSCVFKNQLWVVGGMVQDISGRMCLIRDVECYDPVQNMWLNIITKLPAPRGFGTLVTCNQKVYVVGGTTYKSAKGSDEIESIPDVDCYDDVGQEWMPITPLPNPRHSVSAVNIGGAIFVMGGLTTYRMTALDEVLVHDEDMRSWTACSPMPTYVCGFAATPVPKRYVPIKTHQVKPWLEKQS